MKMFTVYFKHVPSFVSVDSRNVDHTVYTATVSAGNEKDARKKFNAEYMKPSYVKSLFVGKRKTREITKRVSSDIKIVRVFSGDGVRRFDSFAGVRVYRKLRAVVVAKTHKPKWMR